MGEKEKEKETDTSPWLAVLLRVSVCVFCYYPSIRWVCRHLWICSLEISAGVLGIDVCWCLSLVFWIYFAAQIVCGSFINSYLLFVSARVAVSLLLSFTVALCVRGVHTKAVLLPLGASSGSAVVRSH